LSKEQVVSFVRFYEINEASADDFIKVGNILTKYNYGVKGFRNKPGQYQNMINKSVIEVTQDANIVYDPNGKSIAFKNLVDADAFLAKR